MEINIFLLCFNESVLLPNTIAHYKKILPSAIFTIYDNESTDNSVELARSLGCNVISWKSNNIQDEYKFREIKNKCWKSVKSGWIIMADMDEWLCITEEELKTETENGTTILTVEGRQMIGESNTPDLSDIDIHSIKRYTENKSMFKNLCFLREKIIDMNYEIGAHTCNPTGIIKYSDRSYVNKHMSSLGVPFLINKMILRYTRSKLMRDTMGWCRHYTDDVDKITSVYNGLLARSIFSSE